MSDQPQYIRASDAELSIKELVLLADGGTVEIDGASYRAWNSDASGPWLMLVQGVSTTPTAPTGEEFPVIHGTPVDQADPSWLSRITNWLAGDAPEGSDDDN